MRGKLRSWLGVLVWMEAWGRVDTVMGGWMEGRGRKWMVGVERFRYDFSGMRICCAGEWKGGMGGGTGVNEG